jgi:hypothetical protein
MSGQLFTKKRRQYSPTKLATALVMVKTGAMSKTKASKMYGIPRTTLTDKLSGRTAEGVVRPGPSTVLTSAEEDVLVQYSILMASNGYPLTSPVDKCLQLSVTASHSLCTFITILHLINKVSLQT